MTEGSVMSAVPVSAADKNEQFLSNALSPAMVRCKTWQYSVQLRHDKRQEKFNRNRAIDPGVVITTQDLLAQAETSLRCLSTIDAQPDAVMDAIAKFHRLTTTRSEEQIELLAGLNLDPLGNWVDRVQGGNQLLMAKTLANLAYAKDERNSAFLLDRALTVFAKEAVGSEVRLAYLGFFRNLAASDLESLTMETDCDPPVAAQKLALQIVKNLAETRDNFKLLPSWAVQECYRILQANYVEAHAYLFLMGLECLIMNNETMTELIAADKTVCVLVMDKLCSHDYRDRMAALWLTRDLFTCLTDHSHYVLKLGGRLLPSLDDLILHETNVKVLPALFRALTQFVRTSAGVDAIVRHAWVLKAVETHALTQDARVMLALLQFIQTAVNIFGIAELNWLVEHSFAEHLPLDSQHLPSPDHKTAALEILYRLLNLDDQMHERPVAETLRELDKVQEIERLALERNEEISNRANYILQTYFSCDG